MRALFFAAAVCALAPALAQAEDNVRMIGLDESGKTVEVSVPKNEYTNRLTHVMASTRDSAAPVLEEVSKRERDHAAAARDGGAADNPWMLRTVVVGLGVTGTVGFGPLELSATPRFRLGFTNSSSIALP